VPKRRTANPIIGYAQIALRKGNGQYSNSAIAGPITETITIAVVVIKYSNSARPCIGICTDQVEGSVMSSKSKFSLDALVRNHTTPQ
jgi:hypothetical protein